MRFGARFRGRGIYSEECDFITDYRDDDGATAVQVSQNLAPILRYGCLLLSGGDSRILPTLGVTSRWWGDSQAMSQCLLW